MMRVAIAQWQGRVSPVFDVAAKMLIVEFTNGVEQSRTEAPCGTEEPRARASVLSNAKVDVLICGAISRSFLDAISNSAIEVIPQICGQVENVLKAFVEKRLQQEEFFMPGCCGLRRRIRSGRRCRNHHIQLHND